MRGKPQLRSIPFGFCGPARTTGGSHPATEGNGNTSIRILLGVIHQEREARVSATRLDSDSTHTGTTSALMPGSGIDFRCQRASRRSSTPSRRSRSGMRNDRRSASSREISQLPSWATYSYRDHWTEGRILRGKNWQLSGYECRPSPADQRRAPRVRCGWALEWALTCTRPWAMSN